MPGGATEKCDMLPTADISIGERKGIAGEKIMGTDHSNSETEQMAPQHCLKVFIQRDYSEGTIVKFQTRFPTELEGRIERQAFEHTITKLNEYFAVAEKATCSTYCEGCLACLTAYLIYICKETHYEKLISNMSSTLRGKHLHAQAREMAFNVYQWIKSQNEDQCTKEIKEKVSRATGVSVRTIEKIIKEGSTSPEAETDKRFKSPEK
ncbi:hypothetical protein FQA39_LY14312 [Lamprigera yunnana]|nr:hypothetical protein FQA39_LY14312 [Lamprigera yunnana]